MPRTRRSVLGGPGILRRRAGRGFVYTDQFGRRLDDPSELARIKSLVIPPAWKDVWICPWPNGHIQAVGTDAKGRRQYRYHDAWRERRDRAKFDHMLDFAAVLPRVREYGDKWIHSEGMEREKVLACAIYLLDIGFFRVGGEEYAEENGSYGLATLQKSHVHVAGDDITFDYPAKSGQQRLQSVVAPEIREIVTSLKRRRAGGDCLFAYREGPRWVTLRSWEINEHLQRVSGLDATAKDFRTWNATVLAAVALAVSWPAATQTARQRAIRRAVTEVAEYLGNTPAVCRRSYIDPRVIDLYHDGYTVRTALDRLADDPSAPLATHGAAEKAVVRLLRNASSPTER
jgi:DNA topoisomerase IB